MPLPSSINDLSTTAGSNSPAGSESPGLIDDYLRTYASYIAVLRDKGSSLASKNVKMVVTTASSTASLTADEVVVKSGTSGWILSNFSGSLNIAINGPGGMDIGVVPVSGYISIYAIYNPITQAAALLACIQTVSDGPFYTGANMPSGYTASALLSIWPITSGSLLSTGFQTDRMLAVPSKTILNFSTIVSSQSFLSIAGSAPNAAKTINGQVTVSSNALSNLAITLYPHQSTPGGAQQFSFGASPAGATQSLPFTGLIIAVPASIGYSTVSSVGTPVFTVQINGYSI